MEFHVGNSVAHYVVGDKKSMSKWLWIVPMLAASGWSQIQSPIPNIVPMTPVGGFVIPSGTELDVRVNEPLSTDKSKAGDPFTATLLDSVMVNGQTVLAPGTHLTGHVIENHPAGIFKGRARLMLALDAFQVSGHSFPIELTAATYETGHKHKKLETPDPNASAVVGNREAVTIPAETVVHFTLGSPVRV
jgi:hypothetical protein